MEIKVGRDSRPGKVAGAIAWFVREGKCVRARAIGAAALNQAIKAVIVARLYLTLDGIDVICIPAFETIDVDGRQMKIITLTVEPRRVHPIAALPGPRHHEGEGNGDQGTRSPGGEADGKS